MNNDVLLINNTPVQDTVLVPVTAVQADLVTQTDTIVYVPLASKTAPGIVQIGSGLTISDKGLLEFDATEVTIKKILKNGKEIEIVDKTVNITIDKNDVGLSNVDNTADKDKEISDKAMAKFNALEASLSKNISDVNSDLTAHTTNIANPHKVTKTQVGLDRVDNTADKDKPVSTATRNALDALDNKHTNKSDSILAALDDHKANVANPHKVTKSQIGLGNVDNTSDLNKPVSRPVRSELDKLQKQIKGATNTVSYDSYEELVEDVNTLEPTTYFVGQSVYVLTKNVPDLWIYKIHDTPVEFEYKSDADFIKKLTDNDSIQIGYYSFAALETLKVNLDNYVTLDGTQVITGDKNFSGELQQNGKDVALEEDLDNYLPLTAGAGKPLTGALYINNGGVILGNNVSYSSLDADTGAEVNLFRLAKSNAIIIGGTSGKYDLATYSRFRPVGDKASLGGNGYQWKEIYGETIYQDGKQVANKEDVPTEYIKDATVTDNTLTLTKADSTTLNFNGGPTSYIQDATVADDVLTITKSDGSTLAFEGGKPPEVDLSGYLPLTAGSGKKLTSSLYLNNNAFIKSYTTADGLRNLIGVNTSSMIELGDTGANISVKAASNMRPASHNATTLGTSASQWKEIYGTTIYQNGKQVANKEDIPDTSGYFEKIGGAISGDLKLSQTKGVYVTIDNIDYPLVMNTTDGTTYGSASLKTNITGDTINFAKLPQVNGTNLVLSSDLNEYVTKDTEQTVSGTKKFTANNNTFTRTLVLGANTPINFTGIGAGTYNIGAFVCNTIDKFGVECPRESDSASAAIIPFRIGARGGQLGILQAGNIYQNGKQVAIADDLSAVKDATLSSDSKTLTITKRDGSSFNFQGGGGSDITSIDGLAGGTLIASSGDFALTVQSKAGASYIKFANNTGATLGYYGVNSLKQPVFYDSKDRLLAFAENISKLGTTNWNVTQDSSGNLVFSYV